MTSREALRGKASTPAGRSLELLLRHLTPSQKGELTRKGYFTVRANTGAKWRVWKGGSVARWFTQKDAALRHEAMDRDYEGDEDYSCFWCGRYRSHWCHLCTYLCWNDDATFPWGDVALALMFVIKTDEQRLLDLDEDR